ncbi:putative bifunctional diguanylate cyclase/phosphodiesterase [Thiohalomonas denitrificans]|uniref:PAS domain S-box-containing protein/diguanylate cyclase (GGDEF) domain-containing protein n=1 Tax=Thiohalomonas denitrificans TaxID=415747 RepID=A0A1G5QHY5_9GAMM|nr:EAL domain-containing protein [Thiohalomonas denitrificans]SCZ61150.1 PAS domain S-box-containing protein/diguanylate cyclase (GGDEF) domain-containing protein [Thiohalomonas denitrificans]
MRLWGSFRSRFLVIAVVLALALWALAIYTGRVITETATNGVALADESRRIQKTLDGLVWTLQEMEVSLFLYILEPTERSGAQVRQKLRRVGDSLGRLSRESEKRRFPRIYGEVRQMLEDFRQLRTSTEQLIEVASDVETRFPAMPLVRSRLYPATQRFLTALDSAIHSETGLNSSTRMLLELRHLWARQLMESRLFIANRFGVYGAPAASMDRNLQDRSIYFERVLLLLEELAQLDKMGELPFEHSEAVEQMREAAALYDDLFAEVAQIYRSPDWRRDLPQMRQQVEPALLQMWQRVEAMSTRLGTLLEQGIMTAVERARFLGYSLWGATLVAYLFMMIGYVAFERSIRKPLFRVVTALENEGRGGRTVRLPAAGTDEVRLLNAAFEGMRSQLRMRQLRLSSVLDHAHDGVITFGADGRVESFNKSAERLFGYSAAQVIGRRGSFLAPELDIAALPESVVITAGEESGPIVTVRRRDGSSFRMSLKVRRIELEDGPLFTAFVADVTEREELLERLRQMATYDPLTGLYNRRFFMEELGRVIDRAPRGRTNYALLYIDLDNFKYVNDTLGHLIGDRVLVEVTALLGERLRRGDVLARLGGDEFAVLLHESDSERAPAAAEGFRKALVDYRLREEGHVIDVGCSIGIATLDESVNSREQLLANADLACHLAKQQGRNCCHLYVVGDRKSLDSMSLHMGWSQRLKKALWDDTFVIACQPLIELRSGREIAREALLRLPRGDGGMVMPAGFLPAAERFGLLARIDSWVIQRVMRNLADGYSGSYMINLSAWAVNDSRVLKTLVRELDRTGLDPVHLQFEIDEHAAVANLPATIQFLMALRDIGCTTGVDNFGASYGSFSHLRELPVDYVKIDGSYTADLFGDPVRLAMLQALNEVAHAMGKITIAEQVADAQTHTVLQDIGIDAAQGWFFGRPEIFRGSATAAQSDQNCAS